jgi:hypothetical protein
MLMVQQHTIPLIAISLGTVEHLQGLGASITVMLGFWE